MEKNMVYLNYISNPGKYFFLFFKGVMFGEAFKNLPKHLTTLTESAVIVGRDIVDRLWKMKAEIDRRVADIQEQKGDTPAKKPTASTSN
jgi:hypothetical protein